MLFCVSMMLYLTARSLAGAAGAAGIVLGDGDRLRLAMPKFCNTTVSPNVAVLDVRGSLDARTGSGWNTGAT